MVLLFADVVVALKNTLVCVSNIVAEIILPFSVELTRLVTFSLVVA
jgi:hypothetical protein